MGPRIYLVFLVFALFRFTLFCSVQFFCTQVQKICLTWLVVFIKVVACISMVVDIDTAVPLYFLPSHSPRIQLLIGLSVPRWYGQGISVKRWTKFLESLKLDDPLEFNEGDVGLSGWGSASQDIFVASIDKHIEISWNFCVTNRRVRMPASRWVAIGSKVNSTFSLQGNAKHIQTW